MTTMTVDRPKQRTSLGVGFGDPRGRGANPSASAWKQTLGTRPVAARLAVLPEGKSRWSRVWLSAILQVAVVAGAIIVPLLYPESMKTNVHYLTSVLMAQPVTEIPVAPPPPPPPTPKPKITPKVEVKPPDPEPVKLNPQQPHIFTSLVAPKVVQPKVKEADTKLPEMKQVLEAEKMDTSEKGPKRPKEDVKLNNMNMTGSAAPATVKAPPDKVQTGGFGDPNGIAGKGDPNHATNVNRQGSPALPGGEGFGNGTGGKNGIAGTVASTGFGNGTAIPPAGKKGTVVASAGFGAVDTSSDPKKKVAATGPADITPTILDKPRPEYTAEGRSLRIEGDVVIDLVFLANGTIQINRVVNGLGHGLDESAVRAAQQIKFKPAKREGQPVDFPARVHVEFRLAY